MNTTKKQMNIPLWTSPLWVPVAAMLIINLGHLFMFAAALDSNEQTEILEKELIQAGYHKKMQDNSILGIRISSVWRTNGIDRLFYTAAYTGVKGSNGGRGHDIQDAIKFCATDLSDAEYQSALKLATYISGQESYQIHSTRQQNDLLIDSIYKLQNWIYDKPIYVSQVDTRKTETKDAALTRVKAAIDYTVLLKKCHDSQDENAEERQNTNQGTWR